MFIQGGAPSQSARQTIGSLRSVGIVHTQWPFFSPESDPVENNWISRKGFLQYNFAELDQRIKLFITRFRELFQLV